MRKCTGSAIALLSFLFASSAFGQPVFTFDEFGNGAFGPGTIGPDPGPGGLGAVLSYPLPFPGTPGDLLIHDANVSGNPFLDVVRWNGNGRLYFYSDNIDGVDAPADTPSPPGAFYANQVNVQEGGVEGGIEDVFYTPTPGQPGFDPAAPGATYHLISDVPEPAGAAMLSLGAIVCVARRRRRAG